MYINGAWCTPKSNATFDVFNPANGKKIANVADGTEIDARLAIDAAGSAFPSWSKSTAYQRATFLTNAHRIMLSRKDALAEIMTTEQGKPLKAARNEVQYAADFLLWYAEEAKRINGEILPSARPDQRFMVLHQAVGVVAAVTPWNYPISMITRKIAPALAAISRPPSDCRTDSGASKISA